ncbi:DJ-1/PfpI family protein [Dokdonella koreensis]|uniref:ThiJ/PfpI domain-containing protein n=1 Tax=Dokdonella koreensis DS-123 TaxID=1300342 RepID=A0A160DXR4_9GAMM|nr:DJ-1/PfpI family protein [Dokdonella koreensis]ANB19528.1 ThiJ/PfpI domain-containing protein [Dokdonella koreensis DS-123]
MRNIVYFFVFDGFADWGAALALCEIRRPGDYRVRTVGLRRAPVQSMGGLTVMPDLTVDEVDSRHGALLILPGGTAWERGENGALVAALPQWLAKGMAIGALCAGVLALARAGLLERRWHTANYPGYIETFEPGYAGSAQFDASALAVGDANLITASAFGGVEFAREVIRLLDLYDARDSEAWYRLYKYGDPPSWLVAETAPAEALIER